MIAHWIWLAGRPGLGPVNQRIVLELFGSAEAVYAAGRDALLRAGLSAAAADSLSDKELGPAESVACRCAETGIRVLTLADEDYPAPLRAVSDAPTVLYLKGRLPAMGSAPVIGLVGSRDADSRGLSMARQLGWQIAGCGGIVVTGMARGIDAWSAHGALDCGGAVIGVLGCGVDVVYPKQEAALFARVAEQGCLISEYLPGTAPNARHFPARNRIISALSDGVPVIQAREKSGALITARWAADQGRDVFAVPGPAGEALSRGCNGLLRDGAILAENGWDIMSEYEYRYPGAVREFHGRPNPPAPEKEPARTGDVRSRNAAPPEKRASAEASVPPRREPPDLSALTPIQRSVAEALQSGPMQLDALLDRLDLPAAAVLPQLTLLQIKHVIFCHPGKIYSLEEPEIRR